jgi:glycosyltransferase involved in cell wall biosynthesis
MTDIEIPYKEDRGPLYRFFEILPGTLSWLMLFMPLILSLINVTVASVFILAYLLIFFVRSVGVNIRAFQGYKRMEEHKKLPWLDMLSELQSGKIDPHVKRPSWHISNIGRLKIKPAIVMPKDMVQVIMVATYNETREVVEPTIQSILNCEYDMKQVILVLAYEERGGPDIEAQSKALVKDYGDKFLHAMAVRHPSDIPREIRGKGGNISFAARELEKWLKRQKIESERVIITTLDADNRPHPKYLAALSYVYSVYPDPVHISVQPISVYNNNIWDAPAPMRVIATGNTFFNIVLSLRPHMLRNFSAHAQGMKALVATDYWSVRTIVEDGHQFWRSYFRFDGNYRVLPLYVPIYQDAVLADGYWKTLKAQFIQLRRWTYGASDIAYVVTKGFFSKNKVPRYDLMSKTWRLIEGHVTWAVGPIISLTAGFVPALVVGLNPHIVGQEELTALNLPVIVSHVQTVALIGLSASLFVCFKTLPPKPARYRNHRSLFMVLQWLYLPVTTIVYNSFAALYSQTRLMFGKYLDKFDVTEKATVLESGETVSRDAREK